MTKMEKSAHFSRRTLLKVGGAATLGGSRSANWCYTW